MVFRFDFQSKRPDVGRRPAQLAVGTGRLNASFGPRPFNKPLSEKGDLLMMVDDAELSTRPALDDLIRLRPDNSAGADPAVTYRIEDGPLPGGGWFILVEDETAPGALDWATAIAENDIQTIMRPIESGVMSWTYEPTSDTSESSDTFQDVEPGLSASGVVLLPRPAGHDSREEADDDH
jgi:hypothetical protein